MSKLQNTYGVYLAAALLVAGCAPGADGNKKPAATSVQRKQVSSTGDAKDAAGQSGERSVTLGEALELADEIRAHFAQKVRDYTCTLVMTERIGDKLVSSRMFAKIRNPHSDGGAKIPFSVYLKFSAPPKAKGREVIYVATWHKGWLRAHETGARGIATFELNPTGTWAMRENRHPITETGILRLLEQLMEKGKLAQKRPPDEFAITLGDSQVEAHQCQSLQIVNKNPKNGLDFHIVRIDVDKKLNVPVHYEAFDWPAEKGGKPVLLEAYTYLNLKLNVGLTDKDFRCDNEEYAFPKRVIREGSFAFRSLGYLEQLFQ